MKQGVSFSRSQERMKSARTNLFLELSNASVAYDIIKSTTWVTYRIRSERGKDAAVWILLGESQTEA